MSRWLSNVFRLGFKEFASLRRDKVLAFFIIYSFSYAVYSVATGINTDVANALLAIVDSDHSALSARIQDGFLKPYFRRPEFRLASARPLPGKRGFALHPWLTRVATVTRQNYFCRW